MDESQRRRRVALRIILFNLGANAIGYFLVGTYFAVAEGKSVPLALRAVLYDWHSNALAFLLLLLALLATQHATAPLRRWYLESHAPLAPSRRIRTLAVNVPAVTASIALLTWSVRGFFDGGRLLLLQPPDWEGLLSRVVVNLLSGGIAASIAFFGTERLWQPELRIFFPNGHVTASTSGGRLSLRVRMVAFLLLGNLALLVMALLINHALRQEHLLQGGWQRAIQHITALEVVIISAAVITSTLLGFTLIDSLLKAVQRLLDGMEAVKQGRLDVRAEIYLPDEFSQLADGFNEMVSVLRQEETLRSLLDKYVTPEVARHVLEHGAQLGGQQVEGTILFADLRDFTRLSTQLSPQALIALLNQYFNAVNEAIIGREGIINKFGGDSLLVVWAPPFSETPAPARRAVEAAQDMFYRVDVLNYRLREMELPPLRIGIGIASGPLVVGHVGNAQRMEFTVIGASVNLASRLQTLTKDLQTPLLFDENTARQIGALFTTVHLGLHTIRGWHSPLPVYTLPQYAPSPLVQQAQKMFRRVRRLGNHD